MRRALTVLLLGLGLTGCRHWDVRIQGIPLSPQMELTGEEKAATLMIVGIAIGAAVAGAVVALD